MNPALLAVIQVVVCWMLTLMCLTVFFMTNKTWPRVIAGAIYAIATVVGIMTLIAIPNL